MADTEVMVEKKKKTGKQKTIFGLKIAFNVIFYALILLVLIFSIANIRAKNESDQIPNVFGNGYLTVQSNSMEGSEKDSFEKGDMIIVSIANKKNINKLKAGDIITFYDETLTGNGVSKRLNTHRIVYVAEQNGAKFFYTVGDKIREEMDRIQGNTFDYLSEDFKNSSIDEAESYLRNRFGDNNLQLSNAETIRGIYKTKLEGFGKTMDSINKNFLVIIVLPIIVFLLIEIGIFVYNLMLIKNEKNRTKAVGDASTVALTDDEREQMKEQLRQELLNELKKSSTDSKEPEEIEDKKEDEETTKE